MNIVQELRRLHPSWHEGAGKAQAPVVIQTITEIVKVVEVRTVTIGSGQQTQARVVRQGAANTAASTWVPIAAPAAPTVAKNDVVTISKPTTGTIGGSGGGGSVITGKAGGSNVWTTYISPD